LAIAFRIGLKTLFRRKKDFGNNCCKGGQRNPINEDIIINIVSIEAIDSL